MKKLIILYNNFMQETKECHVSAYASSAAFFMFLSLIPLLLLVCAIIPYTPITEANLMEMLAEILPETLVPISVSTVSELYDKSPAIISVTIIVTMWSAGKGMLAIIRGLNTIHGVQASGNYIFQRIKASLYTIVLVVLILISLAIGVFGQVIGEGLLRHFPKLTQVWALISNLRLLVILGILICFFIALFTFTPSIKLYWKTQIVGAVFVSVGWSVFSYAFSIYVNHYTGSSIYGNMTTVALIMMWLYFCFYILFMGALLSEFLSPATEFLIRRANEKQAIEKAAERKAIESAGRKAIEKQLDRKEIGH